MSLLDKFKKSSASTLQSNDEDIDEYEIPSFKPKDFLITSEILRRKREDELRDRYCNKKTKTGDME